jgi:hypothetical protein
MFYLRWTTSNFARPMYAIVRDKSVTWTIKSGDASSLKEPAAKRLLKMFKGGYVEMVETHNV